jgi:hypothetical protein
MSTLVNLTPHEIALVRGETRLVVPPSGTVARAATIRQQVAVLDVDGVDVPVNRVVFGQVENLPGPTEGVWYIVSSIVAQALPERQDLLVPDDTVRDESGRIIGARALAHV